MSVNEHSGLRVAWCTEKVDSSEANVTNKIKWKQLLKLVDFRATINIYLFYKFSFADFDRG